MPWEDPDEQKPGEPEKPLETPELWSHVPNLESFLQELYTRSTGLSTEPTSAQFSALSARVAANSAAGGGGAGSVTSAQFISVMAVVSEQTSALSQAISVLSNQVSVLSNLHSALSNAVSVLSQQVSALSQSVSSQAAALSVRIDTQSQGISVLSNQVSVLSNLHSALSNAVSVISQQVSALSQSLSSQAAALSVRIDTQSQGISVLSNQVSALSQAVSVISVQVVSALSIANAASAAAAAVSADLTSVRNLLSNAVSVLSQQISVLSQQASALSQAHSTLSASHVSLVDRVSANSTLAAGAFPVFGECRLSVKSTTSIVLEPYNGSRLWINGGAVSIPSAGVDLSNSGLTSATTYNIYAFLSSVSVLTLEATTSAHAMDTAGGNIGIEIKTGDATRSLVGKARLNASVNFVDTTTQRFLINWFNQRPKTLVNFFTTTRGTSSTVALEINSEIRVEFLSWGDTPFDLAGVGAAYTSAGVNGSFSWIALDNTSVAEEGMGYFANNTFANSLTHRTVKVPSEGYHYATIIGQASGGDMANWYAPSNSVGNRFSLTGFILG